MNVIFKHFECNGRIDEFIIERLKKKTTCKSIYSISRRVLVVELIVVLHSDIHIRGKNNYAHSIAVGFSHKI